MKKWIFGTRVNTLAVCVSLIAAGCMLLVGCEKDSPPDSPKAVLTRYLDAVIAADFRAAYALTDPRFQSHKNLSEYLADNARLDSEGMQVLAGSPYQFVEVKENNAMQTYVRVCMVLPFAPRAIQAAFGTPIFKREADDPILLRGTSLPRKIQKQFRLNKINDQWRVDLDWTGDTPAPDVSASSATTQGASATGNGTCFRSA